MFHQAVVCICLNSADELCLWSSLWNFLLKENCTEKKSYWRGLWAALSEKCRYIWSNDKEIVRSKVYSLANIVNDKQIHGKRKKERKTPSINVDIQTKVLQWCLTLVVLTLFPVLQDHPVRSGRTLHSSPSMHGCIWHHHFWATIDAGTSYDRKDEEKAS